MDLFFLVKSLHVLSAIALINIGVCIFFWFWSWHGKSDRPENLITFKSILWVERWLAAPCWVIQPLSGGVLIYLLGHHHWLETWLALSYGAYLIALLAWLATLSLSRRLAEGLPAASLRPSIRRGLQLSGLSLGLVAVIFWVMISRSHLPH